MSKLARVWGTRAERKEAERVARRNLDKVDPFSEYEPVKFKSTTKKRKKRALGKRHKHNYIYEGEDSKFKFLELEIYCCSICGKRKRKYVWKDDIIE